jgi:hypothetical protein
MTAADPTSDGDAKTSVDSSKKDATAIEDTEIASIAAASTTNSVTDRQETGRKQTGLPGWVPLSGRFHRRIKTEDGMNATESDDGRIGEPLELVRSDEGLMNEERLDGAEIAGDGEIVYKVYKRRWFGLAQLVLLNIVVSWDVSSPPSPVGTRLGMPFLRCTG